MNRAAWFGSMVLSGAAIAACFSSSTIVSDPIDSPTATMDDGGLSGDAPNEFIAFSTDFTGFQNWQSFFIGEGSDVSGIHIPGPKTVFINKMPPKGSKKFPVGTIIIKAVEVQTDAGTTAPPSTWQVFAMVKRGGGFNELGAQDWEWFGLLLTDSMVPVIEWRGASPPTSEAGGYGSGGVVGVCNNCHTAAYANDDVQTPELQLDSL